MTSAVVTQNPRLRGRLHQAAFIAAVPAAVTLIVLAPTDRARAAAAVFASSLAVLYGVSAVYHLGDWSPRARPWLKRLDHWMIFVLIAASYTPFCLLVLSSPWSWVFLSMVWAGAAAGIALKSIRIDGFHRASGALYITIGWIGILMAPVMIGRLSPTVLALVVAGGALYTIGACVLATHWPDPSPEWFGYHEIWHAFTIAAAACHLAAVSLVVLAAR
ncbi:MAG: hemolysin III family protein [Actinomycetota bacterium]